MDHKLALIGHILLAMSSIAAVTVLTFTGHIDPASALLVIVGASGLSTYGAVTAQRLGSQWPDQSGPATSVPIPPAQPATPPAPK